VHNFYTGLQLKAAVSYITGHAGTVSPVSLDIGANDLLPDKKEPGASRRVLPLAVRRTFGVLSVLSTSEENSERRE
jgi:hypothetical protein